MRQPHTLYLHSHSDALSPLWPPDAPQQEKFHYVGYEVQIDGEIDLETGEFFAQKVQGVPLAKETQV